MELSMVAQTQEAMPQRAPGLITGFKNFLMQGDVIVIAVGLVVALAFSTLIKAFTDNIITPLVNAIGGGSSGLGFRANGQLVNIGAFISAVIYFIIFMAVIYFLIVVPYRVYQARRGVTVFGEGPPVKTCPACLSEDLPAAASKCRYCGSAI
jgi:large conductance mechanosensitive channel